ncbi:MAG: Crp/Fnr family transcriptional regulator [Oxalobacteraceae bacterium]|jgi:CRP/FNR family transcriptional regulator|nr:Crp/Fnr family transcriptional regulator [Oxalobacteraceae bacterium]
METLIRSNTDELGLEDLKPKSRSIDNLPRISSSAEQLFALCGIESRQNFNSFPQKFLHIRVKAGRHVYLSNDKCEMIYLVYSGFLKNTWADTNGNEKIIDFPMKGEMVGLDGIAHGKFANSLKALTDSELIGIPLDFCRRQNVEGEVFRNHIISVLSQQLVNEQKSSFMISALPVDAKVAKFLLSLSFKFKSLGYSEKSFLLRMSREEIGSYLGVSLETVSRTISGLCKIGVLKKDNRSIEIINFDALKKLKRLPLGVTYKATVRSKKNNKSSGLPLS